MPRGNDGSDPCESGCHGGLDRWRWIMAMNHIWLNVAKHAEEAHGSAGNRAFANNMDVKAIRTEDVEEWTLTGIDANRDVVPIRALHTAELDDEYLRTSHLKTVDNVDYFHGG